MAPQLQDEAALPPPDGGEPPLLPLEWAGVGGGGGDCDCFFATSSGWLEWAPFSEEAGLPLFLPLLCLAAEDDMFN